MMVVATDLISLYTFHKGFRRAIVSIIAWAIIIAEILFWVVIVLGLVVRYVFKQQKLSFYLFVCIPIIDVILLVMTAVDLYYGGKGTIAHALAAVYLGISIVYGKSMIQWADNLFQRLVYKKKTAKAKLYGMEYGIQQLKGALKHLAAYVIGALFLALMLYLSKESFENSAFYQILRLWTIVVVIDFIIAILYIIFPRKK